MYVCMKCLDYITFFALLTVCILFKALNLLTSCSDSDSEMEMRFREAAVSVSDILASAAQHLTEQTEEKSMTKESVTAEEVTVTKKKKKKKKNKKKTKASTERSEDNNTHVSDKQSNGERTNKEEQITVAENLTKTKKKKKRRKLEEGKKDCDEWHALFELIDLSQGSAIFNFWLAWKRSCEGYISAVHLIDRTVV